MSNIKICNNCRFWGGNEYRRTDRTGDCFNRMIKSTDPCWGGYEQTHSNDSCELHKYCKPINPCSVLNIVCSRIGITNVNKIQSTR